MKNLSIKTNFLIIILLAALGTFSLASFFSYSLYNQIYHLKEEKLHNLVEITENIILNNLKLHKENKITLEEVKIKSKEEISKLRYDNGNYYWIHNTNFKMVMHPTNPSLNNQDLYNLKDKKGNYFFREMVQATNNSSNSGFVKYYWNKLQHQNETFPKLSFVKKIPELNWIVGTGVYIDDLYNEFINEVIDIIIFIALMSFILLTVIFLIYRNIRNPLDQITNAFINLNSGNADLSTRINISGNNELSLISNNFNNFINKIQTIIHNIREANESLISSIETLNITVKNSQKETKKQSSESETIAAALTKLASTAEEISSNINSSTLFINEITDITNDSKLIIEKRRESLEELTDNLDISMKNINELEEHSNHITEVVDVIQKIADQTNLLALNAAIEAARAGESGRGFSVVAEEVRNLAIKTKSATEEIKKMVDNLHNTTENSVSSITKSLNKSVETKDISEEFNHLFKTITYKISEVNEMSIQIAAASEEQAQVTNSLTGNIYTISNSSKEIEEEINNVFNETNTLIESSNVLKNNINKL